MGVASNPLSRGRGDTTVRDTGAALVIGIIGGAVAALDRRARRRRRALPPAARSRAIIPGAVRIVATALRNRDTRDRRHQGRQQDGAPCRTRRGNRHLLLLSAEATSWRFHQPPPSAW